MASEENPQHQLMRWIAFFVFFASYALIVFCTVLAIFFNVGSLAESYKTLFVTSFIVEISTAVIALFYYLFKLPRPDTNDGVRKMTDGGNFESEKLTWQDALETANDLLEKIKKEFQPNIVIGIGRSGGIWGGWFAGNFGSLPFVVIDDKYTRNDEVQVDFPAGFGIIRSFLEFYPYAEKILVVMGAATRGETIRKFKEQFKDFLGERTVRYVFLYKNSTANVPTHHYYGEELQAWPKKFPWHGSLWETGI